MTAAAVSRADRVRDALAAGVLLAGAAIWLYGYLGLRAIEQRRFAVVPGGPTAVEQAVRFWSFTRVGAGILLVGVGAILWSFWLYYRRRRAQ